MPIQGTRRCSGVARARHSAGHRIRGELPAGFGHNPGCTHWEAAIRYLKVTKNWRLTLGGTISTLAVFTDADWGSHQDDRRSAGGYLIKIGDGVVGWKSKKQSCVASRLPKQNTWCFVKLLRSLCGWPTSWEALVSLFKDRWSSMRITRGILLAGRVVGFELGSGCWCGKWYY